MTRTLPLLAALAAATASLAACGADQGTDARPAAPGSPQNPLVGRPTSSTPATGRTNESAAATDRDAQAAKSAQPGYEALLRQQAQAHSAAGGRPFTPCNLVTRGEARAIVGRPIELPVEAPQGPTCIYRSRDSARFVTVAVQSLDFSAIRPRLRQRHKVAVARRTGYCGHYGQDMLYVPLTGRRVLSIAGPCRVAARFAARAVPRLAR